MKKIFSILIVILISSLNSFAYQIQAGAKTKRIPSGYKIELRMVDPITTSDTIFGDVFTASITKDIIIDNSIVLPQGSLIRGTVGKITPKKILSRSAILYLNFDHVVTPDGQQIPIKAGICSEFSLTPDGAITSGGNYGTAIQDNWTKTIDITIKAANWGIVSGEKLFNGGKYLLTPFSAAIGAIGGGFYFVGDSIVDIFRKGDEVVINQGKTFTILLLDNLDVPLW